MDETKEVSQVDDGDEVTFEKLTPTILEEDNSSVQALKWAINDHEVSKIAITGPYGSGKSSIIKSYQHYYDDKNDTCLNISLASFNQSSLNTQNKATQTENEIKEIIDEKISFQKKIELSLLQQILYKKGPKDFKDSRIQRITSIDPKKLTSDTLFLIFWIFLFLETLKPQIFSSVCVFRNFIENKFDYNLQIFFDLSFFVLSGIILYRLIRIIMKFSIRSMKISGYNTELAIDNGINNSIFNKYLDEIIYFFKESGYKIVFFEDLDRVENCQQVFTTLRELNQLLNSSEEVKAKQEQINFVFALKDDLFDVNTRTKFFDFIIPVIPVINYTNSKQILLDKLVNNQKYNVKEEFIKSVYLFIEDMRVLLNIVNEFDLYINLLSKSLNSLSHDKLLAVIIYKNLYPLDFELHYNKSSLVDELVKAKPKIRYERKLQINSRILEIKENIKCRLPIFSTIQK